jgi:hypothetical protein
MKWAQHAACSREKKYAYGCCMKLKGKVYVEATESIMMITIIITPWL